MPVETELSAKIQIFKYWLTVINYYQCMIWDIQLLRYHKKKRNLDRTLHLLVLVSFWFSSLVATCCNQPQ